MCVVKALNRFILTRKLKGLSDKTIKDYEEFIKPFIKYVGADICMENITHDMIEGYISMLFDRNISKSTISTYVRHLKVFLRWASAEYEVRYFYEKIIVPKNPKKNIRLYNDDEICSIFDAVYTGTDWITARNKAVIAVMLDSGLRQSEVCNLLKNRVSLTEHYISVMGKGDKERLVPLGQTAIGFLLDYYSLCPHNNDYVFVSRDGGRMTPNAVKLMVGKVAKRLPFELSSHKLRHNFATNYCLDTYADKGQIDIYKLMALLGHEDIETTKRYLHFSMNLISAKENISHVDKVYIR